MTTFSGRSTAITRGARWFRSSRTQCSSSAMSIDVLLLGDADRVAELADRLRRVAAPAQPGDRRHARIVPAADVLLLHELQQLALAHHRVGQVQPRELDLLRTDGVSTACSIDPVVERAVVLELERAERVRDAFDRVRRSGARSRTSDRCTTRRRCGGASRAGSGTAPDRACSCSATPCRSSRAARARRRGTRPRASGGTGRGSPRPLRSRYGLSRARLGQRAAVLRGSRRPSSRRRTPCPS